MKKKIIYKSIEGFFYFCCGFAGYAAEIDKEKEEIRADTSKKELNKLEAFFHMILGFIGYFILIPILDVIRTPCFIVSVEMGALFKGIKGLFPKLFPLSGDKKNQDENKGAPTLYRELRRLEGKRIGVFLAFQIGIIALCLPFYFYFSAMPILLVSIVWGLAALLLLPSLLILVSVLFRAILGVIGYGVFIICGVFSPTLYENAYKFVEKHVQPKEEEKKALLVNEEKKADKEVTTITDSQQEIDDINDVNNDSEINNNQRAIIGTDNVTQQKAKTRTMGGAAWLAYGTLFLLFAFPLMLVVHYLRSFVQANIWCVAVAMAALDTPIPYSIFFPDEGWPEFLLNKNLSVLGWIVRLLALIPAALLQISLSIAIYLPIKILYDACIFTAHYLTVIFHDEPGLLSDKLAKKPVLEDKYESIIYVPAKILAGIFTFILLLLYGLCRALLTSCSIVIYCFAKLFICLGWMDKDTAILGKKYREPCDFTAKAILHFLTYLSLFIGAIIAVPLIILCSPIVLLTTLIGWLVVKSYRLVWETIKQAYQLIKQYCQTLYSLWCPTSEENKDEEEAKIEAIDEKSNNENNAVEEDKKEGGFAKFLAGLLTIILVLSIGLLAALVINIYRLVWPTIQATYKCMFIDRDKDKGDKAEMEEEEKTLNNNNNEKTGNTYKELFNIIWTSMQKIRPKFQDKNTWGEKIIIFLGLILWGISFLVGAIINLVVFGALWISSIIKESFPWLRAHIFSPLGWGLIDLLISPLVFLVTSLFMLFQHIKVMFYHLFTSQDPPENVELVDYFLRKPYEKSPFENIFWFIAWGLARIVGTVIFIPFMIIMLIIDQTYAFLKPFFAMLLQTLVWGVLGDGDSDDFWMREPPSEDRFKTFIKDPKGKERAGIGAGFAVFAFIIFFLLAYLIRGIFLLLKFLLLLGLFLLECVGKFLLFFLDCIGEFCSTFFKGWALIVFGLRWLLCAPFDGYQYKNDSETVEDNDEADNNNNNAEEKENIVHDSTPSPTHQKTTFKVVADWIKASFEKITVPDWMKACFSGIKFFLKAIFIWIPAVIIASALALVIALPFFLLEAIIREFFTWIKILTSKNDSGGNAYEEITESISNHHFYQGDKKNYEPKQTWLRSMWGSIFYAIIISFRRLILGLPGLVVGFILSSFLWGKNDLASIRKNPGGYVARAIAWLGRYRGLLLCSAALLFWAFYSYGYLFASLSGAGLSFALPIGLLLLFIMPNPLKYCFGENKSNTAMLFSSLGVIVGLTLVVLYSSAVLCSTYSILPTLLIISLIVLMLVFAQMGYKHIREFLKGGDNNGKNLAFQTTLIFSPHLTNNYYEQHIKNIMDGSEFKQEQEEVPITTTTNNNSSSTNITYDSL